ncbi:MAG: antitoxin [Actinomycetaceae bacterium]|nr:antitoxin [Actinomycetaceae bacterium]
MNFDSIKNKATEAARNAMNDEATSDSVLDKAANAASKVTGGKHDDKIQKARAEADKHVGNERAN